MNHDPDQLTLSQILRALRHRGLLIVACTVLVGGAAYAFSKTQTPTYTASASVVFEASPLSRQIAGLQTSTTSPLVEQAANVQLVQLGDMAALTASKLGHGLSERSVREAITVKGIGESDAVAVTAGARSPALAAAMANAYAEQFVAEQAKQNDAYFRQALNVVEHQLSVLPARQRFGPVAVPLQVRAQDLRFLADLGYGGVHVAEPAVAPASPASPSTSRNVAAGLVVGLLIGLGLTLVLEQLGREDAGLEAAGHNGHHVAAGAELLAAGDRD